MDLINSLGWLFYDAVLRMCGIKLQVYEWVQPMDWQLIWEIEATGETLLQWQSVNHKSHMIWPWMLQREADS
jgi:hypothetical protein